MPSISVVMPSYNHANFIGEAIRSILAQSFDDLELVIVDDGSKDNSNEVVRQFADPRIKHIPLQHNVGACEAMNIALRNSEGELIAVCNSDDVWESFKLERQIALLAEMPEVGAVFSDVTWINDKGAVLDDNKLPPFWRTFMQANRSRFAWTRELIEQGNCLCHPSVLIRKDVYRKLGYYNNYLRQLPDLDMWLRVVQNYEIHIMPDRLMRFRIHGNNTSRQNPVNKVRTWREHVLIARRFFSEITPENFMGSFGAENFQALRSADNICFMQEKVSYLLNHEGPFSELFHEIGVEIAFDLSRKPDSQAMSALEFQTYTGAIAASLPARSKGERNRLLRRIAGVKLYEILSGWNRKRLARRRASKSKRFPARAASHHPLPWPHRKLREILRLR